MISKVEYYAELSKKREPSWKRKVTFENYTYKEVLKEPGTICCVDRLTGGHSCYINKDCKICKLNFIKKHKKDFKKGKEGNTLW